MGAPVSAPPAQRGDSVRRLARSARTTPGRLGIVATALVLLSVLTGNVAALTMQAKLNTITGLVEHREPLSAAAQQIYRSLSDADATASSAFLSGGSEPIQLRERYEIDMAQAGAALAKAASDVGGIPAAEQQVDTLAQQVPAYTGLVETARANNRLGLPIGSAYLREASTLMRSKLLPAAQELYAIDTNRLTDEQDSATGVPWPAAILMLVLLAALIVTQVYLTRKTNRLLNAGLLTASIAIAIGLIWGAVSGLVSASAVSEAREQGTQQVDGLVKARIVALKMRADETLVLVARGDGASYEQEFQKLAPDLLAALGDRGPVNDDDARTWLDTHKKIRELDNGGQFDEAVKLAIGPDGKGAAAAFSRLDKQLSDAIQQGRDKFVESTTTAYNALEALFPGVAVLAMIAVLGSMMGIRQRLQEYR
jgi:hypothetical protein